MNNDSSPRPLILIHVTSASAAFHIINTGKMKCSSNNNRPYKLMLGEGIYFAENSLQAMKKSNHHSVPRGRATIVSIVNLGNTYETFNKEKTLTIDKIKKYGYDSVRCYKLNTGTEYCVYESDRIFPLFAKIQFPEETYYLIGTPNGVMKLNQIPINGMMIKLTSHQIILTDSNNNPFYVFSHEEPQINNKIFTFTHLKNLFFDKVIQRSNNLTLVDCPQLNGSLFDDPKYDSYTGNEFFLEEEDMSDSDEEEEVPLNLRKSEKSVDIVFVIGATSSTKKFYAEVISKVKSIIDQLSSEFSKLLIYSGAVIYRDPVNFTAKQTDETIEKAEIEERVAKLKNFEVTSLHQKSADSDDDYDYDDDDTLTDYSNFKFDKVKFPEGQNTLIDLLPVYNSKFTNTSKSSGLESLIAELNTVKCAGGNNQSEDWAGALSMTLDDVSWRRDSLKFVVWIADSNAHGEKFCGAKDNQEEEAKLEPLVRRLVDGNVNFVGINVMNGIGCKKTLDLIKNVYNERNDLNFVMEEIKQTDSEWNAELVNNFSSIVFKAISELIHLKQI